MKPTLGRIVLYHGVSVSFAAIICKADYPLDKQETVALTVFSMSGPKVIDAVPHAMDDEPKPDHWTWPTRV